MFSSNIFLPIQLYAVRPKNSTEIYWLVHFFEQTERKKKKNHLFNNSYGLLNPCVGQILRWKKNIYNFSKENFGRPKLQQAHRICALKLPIFHGEKKK